MKDNRPIYLIRDQDEGIRPLDLLQAFGPPLRPPLRVQLAHLLYAIALKLDASGDLPPLPSAPSQIPSTRSAD